MNEFATANSSVIIKIMIRNYCSVYSKENIAIFSQIISWVLEIFKSHGFTEFAYDDGEDSPLILLFNFSKVVEIELICPNNCVYGISTMFMVNENFEFVQFVFPFKEREDVKAILNYIICNLHYDVLEPPAEYSNTKIQWSQVLWVINILKSFGFEEAKDDRDSYSTIMKSKSTTAFILKCNPSYEITIEFYVASGNNLLLKLFYKENENIKTILRYIMRTFDFNRSSFYKMISMKTKISIPPVLIGAIAGDIIGSVYEFNPNKSVNFPLFTEYSRFTDDTVMTVANADWLLTNDSLLGIMQEYGNRYRAAGYGFMFGEWLTSDNPRPYNSYGNGSAMRVSPVGWAFDTLEETLEKAKESAAITHNHPEGIKGAQAVAACIYLARTGESKEEIKAYIETTFGYDLSKTCEEIRPTYSFSGSCQGTVPASIIAFLDSTDFEHAIRLAISLGGDADTMGAITGSIAEAYYQEIPEVIKKEVIKRLPEEFINVMERFYEKFVMDKLEKK